MVIATTSSEQRAAVLTKMGADHVINYKDNLEWGQTVKNITPIGQGVNHVIEVGGVRTLRQSMKAVRAEGIISSIGSVSGEISKADNVPSVLECWLNNCVVRGISVGSRAQMEEMVAAVEANDIHPLVDGKSFNLHNAKDAFEYYVSPSP